MTANFAVFSVLREVLRIIRQMAISYRSFTGTAFSFFHEFMVPLASFYFRSVKQLSTFENDVKLTVTWVCRQTHKVISTSRRIAEFQRSVFQIVSKGNLKHSVNVRCLWKLGVFFERERYLQIGSKLEGMMTLSKQKLLLVTFSDRLYSPCHCDNIVNAKCSYKTVNSRKMNTQRYSNKCYLEDRTSLNFCAMSWHCPINILLTKALQVSNVL